MSELTRCNYCTLEGIKKRTPITQRVVVIPANGGGFEIFRVPNDSPTHKEHFVAWLMELTDHCVC